MPLVNPVFANKEILTAGENLSRGEIVQPETGTGSLIVVKNAVDSFVPIGVVVADALDTKKVLIQYAGLAYILPEAAATFIKNYIIFSSGSEAGRAQQQAAVPANTDHFRECGHLLEAGIGAGALARAIIHFN